MLGGETERGVAVDGLSGDTLCKKIQATHSGTPLFYTGRITQNNAWRQSSSHWTTIASSHRLGSLSPCLFPLLGGPLPLPPLNFVGGSQDTHERSGHPCGSANTKGEAGVENTPGACDLAPCNSNTQCRKGGLAWTQLSLGTRC